MEYYVYIYLDPLKPKECTFGKFHFDCEPFYIGMGKKNRIHEHISESKKLNKKSFKHHKILKILKNGQEPIRYKLYENLTIESAKRLEKCLIKLIGRRDLKLGPLTNLTDGGDGTFNHKHRQDSIDKMIKSIGNSRKGILNANYGNNWTEEQIKLSSIRQKENHQHFFGDNNPSKRIEVRKKISETKMGILNPNANIWELISPNNEKFIIEGGIKRSLKEHELTYTKMKYKVVDGVYYSKNGWKMYKVLDI